MWPFSKSKNILGIDIGTASIKIVEMKKDHNAFKLENYGELRSYQNQPDNAIQTSSFKMLDSEVANLLKQLLNAINTKTKKAVFSIPLFSSFITLIEIPRLTKKEIETAISFEAREYVPVPIEEVVLDWSIVGSLKSESFSQTKEKVASSEKIQVLLVAVPKEIIEKYQRIARLAKLNLVGIEVESFALARSLTTKDKKTVCVLDIGAGSTNICIIEDGYIKLTHNLDISGRDLTRALADGLSVSFKRAEIIKKKQGLKLIEVQRDVYEVLISMLDNIISETEKYISLFSKKSGKNVEKIILAGGSANLPGLDKYIFEKMRIKTEIGNPFRNIIYPPQLNPIIKELGPIFDVSIGLVESY